jgi:hypothetical protein
VDGDVPGCDHPTGLVDREAARGTHASSRLSREASRRSPVLPVAVRVVEGPAQLGPPKPLALCHPAWLKVCVDEAPRVRWSKPVRFVGGYLIASTSTTKRNAPDG